MFRRILIVALAAAPCWCVAAQQKLETSEEAASAFPLTAGQKARFTEAMQVRDYETAEKVLVSAVDEHDPKSRPLLEFLGGLFFADKKYLNCAIAIAKAEKLGPLQDGSRFKLAMSYVVLKRPEWARPELEKLARSDTANPLYPYWLGRLDYDARLYKPAIASFQKAIALDAGFMRAYDNLGLALDMTGQLDEAVAAYTRATELNRREFPPSPWPPFNLGVLLLKMGRHADAEELLREATGYDPKFGNAYYRLGVCLEKQGKLADAVPELARAAELNPDSYSPHLALGRVFRALGRADDSKREFAEFRRLKKEERPQP